MDARFAVVTFFTDTLLCTIPEYTVLRGSTRVITGGLPFQNLPKRSIFAGGMYPLRSSIVGYDKHRVVRHHTAQIEHKADTLPASRYTMHNTESTIYNNR